MAQNTTLVVCQSVHHGNTVTVARAIADTLHADIRKPSEVDCAETDAYDLIGFGSGIFWGKHHMSLLKLADGMPNLESRKVFIFSTSGMSNAGNLLHNTRHLIAHFHVPLRRALQSKGARIVGEFSCRGFDTAGPLKWIGGLGKGRPNRTDIENAKRFSLRLKDGASHGPDATGALHDTP